VVGAGAAVGDEVGSGVADALGDAVGDALGVTEGEALGEAVGLGVGFGVGFAVGAGVGVPVGAGVGDAVGTGGTTGEAGAGATEGLGPVVTEVVDATPTPTEFFAVTATLYVVPSCRPVKVQRDGAKVTQSGVPFTATWYSDTALPPSKVEAPHEIKRFVPDMVAAS
jgi:hypothetical protein